MWDPAGGLEMAPSYTPPDISLARERVGTITIATNANAVYKLQRQLFARSERVKGIDFHPVEPWILTTLYSGMFWRFGRGEFLIANTFRPCLHLVV